MPVRKAVREGPVHLAAGNRRHSLSVASTAFDVARRHRLAQTSEEVDTANRRMSNDEDSPVFMRFFLLHLDEIDGILNACFRLRCLTLMRLIPQR